MRVVVTRPEAQGRETARRLRAMGHNPVLLPLFAPLHDLPAARHAMDGPARGLIFTSAEAVRALGAAIADLAPFHDLPVFTVGRATAQAAAELGFGHVVTASGNGASLAALIRDRQPQDSSAPLLYLAGEPRSGDLEAGLAEGDVPFRTTTVYRMEPVEHASDTLHAALAMPSDRENEETAVLLYSAQAVQRFLALCAEHGAEIGNCRFLCLSQAIAAALLPAFQARARVAAQPLEAALLDLMG